MINMKTFFLLLSLLVLSAAAAAQRDLSKVEIKVEKVSGSVYMLTGAGGNIGACVGDDGVLLIDDQFQEMGQKIKDAVKSISNKPIRLLVNTHWHGDHTGSNPLFGVDTVIMGHTNVRKRLQAGSEDVLGSKAPPAPKVALPLVTYEDGVEIHLNGETIRARHFPPGHTDGDTILFFPSANVVHMGDDFFNGMFPFIDLNSGGSAQGLLKNVDKVLSELPGDVKIIPGHGPLATKADLRKFAEMLRDTLGIVRSAMQQGKSLEQMKKDNVLAKYAELGKGFMKTDAYLEILYNDLKTAQ